MKKNILFLLFSLIFFIGFSQNKPMYSQQLVDTILKNVRYNPKKAILHSKELLQYSQANKKLDSIGVAYLYLAKSNRVNGTYDEALDFAEKGIRFAKKINLSYVLLAELQRAKGNVLADMNRVTEVLPAVFLGVEYAEKSNDIKTQIKLNHTLGFGYYYSGRYKKSIEIIKNNLDLIEKNELIVSQIFQTYYKGMIILSQNYLSLNKKDSAVYFLNKGLENVLESNDFFTCIRFHKELGAIYLDEKNYEKAYSHLIDAKELGNKMNVNNIFTKNNFLLAKYFFEISDYQKSIDELIQITTFFKNENKEDRISSDIYELLGKNYKLLGNFKLANTYFEKSVFRVKKEFLDSKTLNTIMQEKEISFLEIETNQLKNKKLVITIISAIIIIFLLYYFFITVKKRKKEAIDFNASMLKISALDSNKTKHLKETTSKELNKETFDSILAGLKKLETKKLYLNADITTNILAKDLKTNSTYLSKVINSYYQKSFKNYINDLRIKHIVNRLKQDLLFRKYTIESIALDSGFKSKQTFNKAFKERKGMLPSQFIKQLNKN